MPKYRVRSFEGQTSCSYMYRLNNSLSIPQKSWYALCMNGYQILYLIKNIRTNQMRYRQQIIRWKSLIIFLGMGLLLAAPLKACTVEVSWNANTESDLTGYKVYYGTEPGVYYTSFDVGNVTEYEVSGLTIGTTYYFVVTAYDDNGNESDPSEEVPFYAADEEPPTIASATCVQNDRVVVVFSESVENASAELISNYSINNGVVIQVAELQSDLKTVHLFTTLHMNGSFLLTVNNVRDNALVNNTIETDSQVSYEWQGNDEVAPEVASVELKLRDFLIITFTKPLNQTSALNISNYTISPSVEITGSAVDDSFTKVYLMTASHTPGQSYTLTINNVKDGQEPPNFITANTQVNYDCIAEDTNPPTLIAAHLQGTTELQIEFGEDLDPTTAVIVSNYTITPSVAISSASLMDSRTVVLTTAAHTGGDYTITVSGVGDDADPPNLIESGQLDYTYTPPDIVAPVLEIAELTGDDLLRLTFSESLDKVSAEDISNYIIEPLVNIRRATLDVSRVKVLLETDPHAIGSYQIVVNGVKDLAETPNTIEANSYVDYLYDPPDTSPPRLLQAQLNDSNFVELIFDEALDRTSVENVSHYQISPFIEILSVSLVGDSLNRVYLETNNHQSGQSYILTVNGIMDRAAVPNTISAGTQASYEYPAIDMTPPRLVSVELQGGDRFLKLVFSESLQQESAQDIGNYTIYPDVDIEEATLDVSLKTVLLKTKTHHPGDYTLIVQSVMDRADPPNAIGSDNQMTYTCLSQDVTAPLLIRAELHGNQTVELNFSEPLERNSALKTENYSIDNGISISQVSIGQSQMEVFLETSQHQQGTYKITVNDVIDMAAMPNTITPDSWVTYTYLPADTTPPALLAVTLSNPTMVELIFNESLDRTSVENTNNYSINNGITVERAILDFTGTQVVLQTSTHTPGTYAITLQGIKDGSSGKNTILPNTTRQYSYVTNDVTPPYIVSAKLNTDVMLVVTFNESLDRTSAREKSHYVIDNNITIETAFMNTSDRQVILQTTKHAAGEYILTVNGVKDASTANNVIAPYSQIQYSWTPEDSVGPELVSVTSHTNSYLELEFSEPIDGVESQKVENYQIVPPIQVQNAVLDASLNRIWLFTASHNPGSYTITVSNVTDRAFTPNGMGAQNSVLYHYTPPDTDPPNLVSVQLRTPMSLAIVFDEPLSRANAENLANFTIQPSLEVKHAYLLATLQTIHLETAPHQPGVSYSISIRDIQDRSPSPNMIASPITQEYTYTPPDTARPKLLSVKFKGAQLLELVFSEELEKTSAENCENYSINPSVEVIHVFLDPVSLMSVNLETSTHVPGIGYEVSVQNVKDRAPIANTISPNTWLSYSMPISGGTSDNVPPQVARIDVISTTQMDIVFTEPVSKTTAEIKTNYTISDNIKVQSALLDSNLVRVHLTTTPHEMGKAYQINVSNIMDQASQPNILSTENPVKYLLSQGVTLSNLNRANYDISLLQSGGQSYVDRDYTISQAPDYTEDCIQILTANDDKSSEGDNFITFQLRGDATIYVAYDKQISQLPDWLSSWKAMGEQIVDSRSNVFNIYSTEANGGRTALGGNQGSMDDNMYLTFVKPHFASGSVLASLSKESYSTKHIKAGDTYYIDRDYTINSVPDSLQGLLWIQTANDDKIGDSPDFLKFNLNWGSRVYVAYDENISSLPDWLTENAGWQMIDEQIVDSRGARFDIFYKQYSAGEVALGGNCGSVDDNMYIVMIQPTEVLGRPDVDSQVPGYFTITQNYPNPFNPETKINYSVEKAGRILITVYNVLGQKVKVLVDREISNLGPQEPVVWQGDDEMGNPVASGLYFYRIQKDHFAKTRRMILMR